MDQGSGARAGLEVIPPTITTPRLRLRSWHPSDAPRLLVALEQNLEHLRRWIPAAVYTPAPTAELEARLASYASDFAANRAWRFAILLMESNDVLGEASLFPRSVRGRVALVEADSVEIGYWLRADMTGQGFAAEAARALIDAGSRLPGIASAEIRCDSRNEPSAAIPRKLGFFLAAGENGETTDMVWRLPLPRPIVSRIADP